MIDNIQATYTPIPTYTPESLPIREWVGFKD